MRKAAFNTAAAEVIELPVSLKYYNYQKETINSLTIVVNEAITLQIVKSQQCTQIRQWGLTNQSFWEML